MTTVIRISTLLFILASALGDGELNILHSPKGIIFTGKQVLKTSDLPQMLLAATGHTTYTDNSWNGLSIPSPFNYPKTTVVIVFDGMSSLKLFNHTYPLHLSSSGLEKTKSLLSATAGKILDESNLVTKTKVEGFILDNMNIGEEAVIEFVNDMGLLADLKQMISTQTHMETVWVQLKGLGKVAQQYGLEASETQEAIKIVKNMMEQLEDALQAADGDKYFLVTISNPHHARHIRAAKDDIVQNYGNLNLSKRYDESYSAIFNIILFTSIFLLAALISTAVFICTLDPGRDSIIYRMTTQRKKDN